MKKRSGKKFNLAAYKNELLNVDWSELYKIENIELASSFLTEKVRMSLDRSAPMRTVQQRKDYKSWIKQHNKGSDG